MARHFTSYINSMKWIFFTISLFISEEAEPPGCFIIRLLKITQIVSGRVQLPKHFVSKAHYSMGL